MKRGFTLIEALVVLAILAILAAITLPVFDRGDHDSRRSSCQGNLKMIALGLHQYFKDYDARFPFDKRTDQRGWAEALQPYVKSWAIFACPTAGRKPARLTDYYFNRRLAGRGEKTVRHIKTTVLLGEGEAGSPPFYALSMVPPSWESDTTSPLYRHTRGRGANFAFVDGSVRFFIVKKRREQPLDFAP